MIYDQKNRNLKKGNIELLFLDGNKHWQSLTNKQTGEFLASKRLREKFGGLKTMKNFFGINKRPPVLERSFKVETRLNRDLPTDLEKESIPLERLLSLFEDIDVKTQESSQNTDLDMREFLIRLHKAIKGIKGGFLNNMSKQAEIDKSIKRDTKKLEEVEKDPTYADEQMQE